eukprot:2071764-Rhodomonas_salina.5
MACADGKACKRFFPGPSRCIRFSHTPTADDNVLRVFALVCVFAASPTSCPCFSILITPTFLPFSPCSAVSGRPYFLSKTTLFAASHPFGVQVCHRVCVSVSLRVYISLWTQRRERSRADRELARRY